MRAPLDKAFKLAMGERIRKKREEMGLSRERFAELIDMTTHSVAQIELGNRAASYISLRKICDLLGVTADYVLYGVVPADIPDGLTLALSRLDAKYMACVEQQVQALLKAVYIYKEKDPDNE